MIYIGTQLEKAVLKNMQNTCVTNVTAYKIENNASTKIMFHWRTKDICINFKDVT